MIREYSTPSRQPKKAKKFVSQPPKIQMVSWFEPAELEILLITHKIVHKNCSPYLHDLVNVVSDVSSRSSRAHKFKLSIPLVGAGAPESSFSVKACRLWNKLSENVCANQNINSFKSVVKNVLFKRYEEDIWLYFSPLSYIFERHLLFLYVWLWLPGVESTLLTLINTLCN